MTHSPCRSAKPILFVNLSCPFSTTYPTNTNFIMIISLIFQFFIWHADNNLTPWPTPESSITFILNAFPTKKGYLDISFLQQIHWCTLKELWHHHSLVIFFCMEHTKAYGLSKTKSPLVKASNRIYLGFGQVKEAHMAPLVGGLLPSFLLDALLGWASCRRQWNQVGSISWSLLPQSMQSNWMISHCSEHPAVADAIELGKLL